MTKIIEDFSKTDIWVFDLDNTLYPPSSPLFDQVHAKMNDYIMRLLGMSAEDAQALRHQLFRQYGTTLCGLMTLYQIEPDDFLEHVHDLDLSVIPQSKKLDALLHALPGRKVIYTNASTAHAENVLQHLGIEHHFDGVFDIISAGYRPKPHPDPYKTFIREHGIDPRRACMIEDIAINLKPAHDMGMKTVWLKTEDTFAMPPSENAEYIHHIANDVEDFLSDLTAFFAAQGKDG